MSQDYIGTGIDQVVRGDAAIRRLDSSKSSRHLCNSSGEIVDGSMM